MTTAIDLFPGRDGDDAPYRRTPANEEAEQALLGAIMINNDAIDRVSEFLKPEHFYFPAHGRIFAAMLRFREQHRLADPLTLKDYFERDGDLEGVGGAQYLARLAGGIVSVVNAVDYARIIHDLHLRRQLIALAEEITTEAYDFDLESSATDQIQGTEEKLYGLATEGDFQGGFQPFQEVLKQAIQSAQQALYRDTRLTGATTGLVDMDRMLGGLQPSDLLILAGRPAMGKTALATNMAFNAAKAYVETDGKEGAVVAFFSLEMSAEQLAVRILSEEAEIASEKIRKGEMKRADFPRLTRAAETLERVPLYVDDTAGLTINQLRTRALRLKRQHDLGLIVVDYLQLMRPGGSNRADNRVQEISEITRGLKMVAKDLNVPVLALSQLSRAVEQREDKRPQLADLRESGSIEQDADVVMFVFREAYYVSKREPSEGTPEHDAWQQEMDRVHNLAEVIVAKQRHGPTGAIRLHFEGMFTRFSNLEQRYGGEELG
ncbi:MAG: replicative DNA helicase [Alphaproteobacteria bacterium]|jgi:replicative DNA helicase|nr:replicative DNA helicase [Alphaproteobacteria bacterium]